MRGTRDIVNSQGLSGYYMTHCVSWVGGGVGGWVVKTYGVP